MLLTLSVPFLMIEKPPIYLILKVVFLLGSIDLLICIGYQIFIVESVRVKELLKAAKEVGLIFSVYRTFKPGFAVLVIIVLPISMAFCSMY